MNERQKELLRALLVSSKDLLHIENLAEDLHCSEKTVRNDLNLIEAFLQTYPGANLVRKPGMGLYLEIDTEERAQVFQTLYQTDSKTEEERMIKIAYRLLVSDKPVTLKQLAEEQYTNKTTIKKDLVNIAGWLKRFELSLVSKQRIGSSVTGSELNKRNALAHLSELISSITERNYVLDLFPSYEITTVRKVLKDLQVKYSVVFTAGGLESMLIHALIMIRRTRQQSQIIIDIDKEATSETMEYEMSEWFFNQLENVFRITFPENEQIYYTWHLISSIKRNELDDDAQSSISYLPEIIGTLTKRLQQLTMIHFADDSILVEGLTVHLHAVMTRISYGFAISNPLLADIKKMYPYMFSMIVLALEDIKCAYDLDIPEDEAAYLVLHFQASIERLQKKREKKKQVLIVCHMGVGMSRLLQAKLEQNYTGIHVLDCIGKTEVKSFLENNPVDFIISTVFLEKSHVPSIVISPLLEAKDKARLNEFYQLLEGENATNQTNSSLIKLVDKDSIFLHVGLEHRFEVVEMLANALLANGLVDRKFVHSALLRERTSATSIGGGIAIPHAQPDTVEQSAVAVAVMKKPVEWGNEMVSVIFLLAIANGEQPITRELMQQISSISGKPMLVNKLTEANGVSDILTILTE